jgi:hypothetical protein
VSPRKVKDTSSAAQLQTFLFFYKLRTSHKKTSVPPLISQPQPPLLIMAPPTPHNGITLEETLFFPIRHILLSPFITANLLALTRSLPHLYPSLPPQHLLLTLLPFCSYYSPHPVSNPKIKLFPGRSILK